jgi:hypothetical protein
MTLGNLTSNDMIMLEESEYTHNANLIEITYQLLKLIYVGCLILYTKLIMMSFLSVIDFARNKMGLCKWSKYENVGMLINFIHERIK